MDREAMWLCSPFWSRALNTAKPGGNPSKPEPKTCSKQRPAHDYSGTPVCPAQTPPAWPSAPASPTRCPHTLTRTTCLPPCRALCEDRLVCAAHCSPGHLWRGGNEGTVGHVEGAAGQAAFLMSGLIQVQSCSFPCSVRLRLDPISSHLSTQSSLPKRQLSPQTKLQTGWSSAEAGPWRPPGLPQPHLRATASQPGSAVGGLLCPVAHLQRPH